MDIVESQLVGAEPAGTAQESLWLGTRRAALAALRRWWWLMTGRRRPPKPRAVLRTRHQEPAAPSSAFASIAESELRAMGRDLCALLDRHPRSRGVAAHLAVLERVLRREPGRAVDRLPHDVLRRAGRQLQLLTPDDGALSLQRLQSALALAMTGIESAGAQRDATATQTAEPDMEVDGVGLSRFMAADEAWNAQLAASRNGTHPLEGA